MSRMIQLLAVGISLIGLSSVASAQNAFQITGEWNTNRGANVDIPAGGGPFICDATPANPPGPGTNAVAAPCVRHKALGATERGFFPAAGGAPAPLQGVTTTDASNNPITAVGNTIRVPANIFSFIPTATPNSAIPVIANPVVQQLNTTFTFMAPGALRVPNRVAGATLNGGTFATAGTVNNPIPAIGPNQAPGNTAVTRLLRKTPWGTANTSRVSGTFLWTRGGGTATNPTRQISYTPKNATGFGGTMHMLLGGTATVWVVANISPAQPDPEALASPVSGNGTQGQQPGRGYSTSVFRRAPNGQVYDQFNIPTPCAPLVLPPSPAGCGLLTGVAVPLFPIPGATTVNAGFPWTTGHVSIMVDYLQGANPRITTLSASGSDTIVSGVRTLQLVSAGVSFRQPPGGGNPTRSAQLDTVSLKLLPEPNATLALAGVLGVIGVLYAVRSRFA